MKEDSKTSTDHPAGVCRQEKAPRSRLGRSRSRMLFALTIVVPAVLLAAVAILEKDRPESTSDAGASPADQGATTSGRARGGDGLQVEGQAPTFSVTTLSGGTFEMPGGKPTLLTFVNLCPTCLEDTRKIGALQERFGDVAVLAVASDPTADRARMEDFIQQAGNPDFELALDPHSTLTQRFDAFSMAANVLVTDPTGRITYRGPVDEKAIETALVEAGARP